MNEFIGLAYYAEMPAVVFDVQRTGPSTGMPTRTQQGDLMLVRLRLARRHPAHLLFPSDPREAFEMAVKAFDLAERFQTPVFVLRDLDIGMNDWMVPKLAWDDSYRPDRGKVLSADELEECRSSTATSTWMATASRTARCRACTRRARTSRAARATTSTAPTPRTRRVPGSAGPHRAQVPARAKAVPAPVVEVAGAGEDGPGHHRRLSGGVHGGDRPDGEGRHRHGLHARRGFPFGEDVGSSWTSTR